MSPHCVWLVIVGGHEELILGDDGGGVVKPLSIFIEDTNRLIMIIELGKSYAFNHFCPFNFIFVYAFTNNFCFVMQYCIVRINFLEQNFCKLL